MSQTLYHLHFYWEAPKKFSETSFPTTSHAGSETELIEFDAQTASPFPLIRCRNIYCLPGIPSLLHSTWPRVLEEISRHTQAAPQCHSIMLRLSTDDETVVWRNLGG